MTYLFNIDQLCQHFPRVMHSPFDRAQWQAFRSRNLAQGVAFGDFGEGGHRHRPRLQVTDNAEDVVHPRPLVGLLAARLVPLAQPLGVGGGQLLLGVQPQVAHDCPAPCEQRTAVVVSVASLQRTQHGVGGEVVGSLIAVVASRLIEQRAIRLHDALFKGHGSCAASLGRNAAWW